MQCWALPILVTAAINCLGVSAATNVPTNVGKKDLTAKECLAQANRERLNKNWDAAIEYYEHFDKEYGGTVSPPNTTLRHRLEYLECLLVSKRLPQAIPLIETLCADRSLNTELICDLLFAKGKAEYQMNQFSSARNSLATALATAQGKLKTATWKQKVNEAHLLIAQCLIALSKTNEALQHLSTSADLDPQTQAICFALKTRLHLDMNRPDQAWSILKENLSCMRSWNLPATSDDLLLETANQFCGRAAQEKSVHCILLTIDPFICLEAIDRHIKQIEAQLSRQSSAGRPLSRSNDIQRVLSLLSNERHIVSSIQERRESAVQTVAKTLLSQGRFRETAVLLHTFTSIPCRTERKVIDQMRSTLLGCLLQMQRCDDAVKVADTLQSDETEEQLRNQSALLKGIALSKSNSTALAIHSFQTLLRKSNLSACATQAAILCASTQLESGEYLGAIETASNFISSNPKHPFCDSAHCILSAAQLADRQYGNAIESTTRYLNDRLNGENRESMFVYKARAQLGLRKEEAAIKTLTTYVSECPNGGISNEALLLLGETFLSLGESNQGISALRAVTADDLHAFDKANLLLAKALLIQLTAKASADHLVGFIKNRVQSDRIADACRALLQTSSDCELRETAITTLWELFAHSDKPCQNCYADAIITILEKAYLQDGRSEQFGSILNERCSHQSSLQLPPKAHCHCSIVMLWAAWRNSCRSDPARATDEFQKLEVAAQQMPSMVSPQIFSDIAKQLHENGKDQQAIAAWHQLLKWHPNTALKDVALFRLGDAAADGNDMEKAASFFGRLENECRNSALLPETLLKRSNIYRKNNETQKQIADLTRVAAAKIAPIKVRAQALVELGELKIERQEYANAIVYFQRTYVTCIASREHAARAYERCAFAFEKLSRPDAAAQVYKELIQHPDLVATDAAKECKSRILGTPDP